MFNFKFITMKKIQFSIIIIFLISFLFSCGQKPDEMIVGEWKIAEISSTNEIPEELKEAHKQSLDEMKESYLLVIKADSTFEHTISETTNVGKWNLSPDAKVLTLTYDNGVNEISNIIELSDMKLVTSVEFNDSKNTITFEKQIK